MVKHFTLISKTTGLEALIDLAESDLTLRLRLSLMAPWGGGLNVPIRTIGLSQ